MKRATSFIPLFLAVPGLIFLTGAVIHAQGMMGGQRQMQQQPMHRGQQPSMPQMHQGMGSAQPMGPMQPMTQQLQGMMTRMHGMMGNHGMMHGQQGMMGGPGGMGDSMMSGQNWTAMMQQMNSMGENMHNLMGRMNSMMSIEPKHDGQSAFQVEQGSDAKAHGDHDEFDAGDAREYGAVTERAFFVPKIGRADTRAKFESAKRVGLQRQL